MATIPVGPEGVSYELGAEPWGPGALAVSPGGVLWVLDSVALGVVNVDGDEFLRISLADVGVYAVVDLAFVEDDLWVLGYPTMLGVRLLQLAEDGSVGLAIELPDVGNQARVMGLVGDPDGGLWLEFDDHYVRFQADPPGFVSEAGSPYPGGPWRVHRGPKGTATFVAGDVEVPLQAAAGNEIGVQLLGVNPDDSFVIEVDEIDEGAGHAIQVVQHAIWFSPDGTQRAEAEIPMSEQFMYVPHPIVLGPDGYLYYLLTQAGSVKVLRLAWHAPS